MLYREANFYIIVVKPFYIEESLKLIEIVLEARQEVFT